MLLWYTLIIIVKKLSIYFDDISVRDFFPSIKLQVDILRQALPASLNMFCRGGGFFIIAFFASFFPTPDTSDISADGLAIAQRPRFSKSQRLHRLYPSGR